MVSRHVFSAVLEMGELVCAREASSRCITRFKMRETGDGRDEVRPWLCREQGALISLGFRDRFEAGPNL